MHEKPVTENLEKRIKRNIYGKPQSIEAIFPPGFSDVALQEIKTILSNLWFPQKYSGDFSILKNLIRINNIHFSAVTELLMRSQSLSDIRLIIFEGNASGREAFSKKCHKVNWNFFLKKTMTLKIKVNSVASRAFHETGLKKILSEIIQEYVLEIVHGEGTSETTSLYVDLYQDHLTMSLSLAGNPLYKRGYRGILSSSAPLREDLAFCCIQKSLEYCKKIDEDFHTDAVLIPFSGTGTFAFEYLQSCWKFSPALFSREYGLQEMPLFRKEQYYFLLKEARKQFLKTDKKDTRIICIDYSKEANSALIKNIENIENAFLRNEFSFAKEIFFQYENDFIKMDVAKVAHLDNSPIKAIFIPINPPYGIRLRKNNSSVALYKKIAEKLTSIQNTSAQKKLAGFILCPDQETWSVFCKNITDFTHETYHFTQGGLDVRVCQFFST